VAGNTEAMPTEPQPVTLAQVIHRAVEVCELGEPDEGLDELLERFEDADEPVRAIEDVELRLDEALGAIDVDWEDLPPLAMAQAVAVYLAFRPDELGAAPAELLRLAARAEFEGHPPPNVAEWLRAAGVQA
jgi:hypothetical protein